MNTNNKILGFLVVVALVLGIYSTVHAPKQGAVGPQGPVGIKGDRGPVGPTGPQGSQGSAGRDGATGTPGKVGALSGPDLPYPYLGVNSLREWSYTQSMTRAASTTCSFQLPYATTTLSIPPSANMTVIASTTVFEIGYSAVSPNATTTLIAQKTITTATKDTIVATSTFGWGLGALTPPYTFAPRSFINYKIGGGSVAGTNDPAGTCHLKVQEVS